MNYLHESQGHTLSKTVEERYFVCRKGDGERYFIKSSIHYKRTSAESKHSCLQGKKKCLKKKNLPEINTRLTKEYSIQITRNNTFRVTMENNHTICQWDGCHKYWICFVRGFDSIITLVQFQHSSEQPIQTLCWS